MNNKSASHFRKETANENQTNAFKVYRCKLANSIFSWRLEGHLKLAYILFNLTLTYRVSQKTWEFSDEFDIVFVMN